MASQSDHRATFSPKRPPHKAAGLLATSSDDAHAPGHQEDPNQCEDSYHDLPTVRPTPSRAAVAVPFGFSLA